MIWRENEAETGCLNGVLLSIVLWAVAGFGVFAAVSCATS